MARTAAARSLGVPGARLFSRLARSESPLQADSLRSGLGRAPAARHRDHLHFYLRQTRRAAVRRRAVSGLCSRRSAPVAVIFGGGVGLIEQPGRQREPDYEGVLPTTCLLY